MKKIRLGKTEMMVTRLGFGGIPIQRVSEDEAIAVIKRCLELGITFIDTVNGYTTSEERIGKAIAGQREKLIIATKSLARTRDEIEKHLKLSLERLGVEYVDLYQFHNVSDADTLKTILDPDGPRAVIEEARRAGKVKHIGISCHPIDVAKEAVKSDCFETIMFPLNFIYPDAKNELLPLVREHDMGFIAMKPLAGGMISNASIAFKYLFQFPDVVLNVGIERVHEIEEIVQLVEEAPPMTSADREEMARLTREVGARFCRRCDYCQPCTEGVPISNIMSYPNLAKRLPPVRLFTGKFADSFAKAANCIDCGECEERCPYQLPIREMMKEYVKLYEAEKKKYEENLAPR